MRGNEINSKVKWSRNGSDNTRIDPYFDDPEASVHFIQDGTDEDSDEDWIRAKKHQRKESTNLEKCLIALVFILIIIILVLAAVGTFGYYYTVNNQVCLEPECIEISSSILSYMDLNADPCEDFYQYSCGRFLKEVTLPAGTAKWSSFSRVYAKIQEILKKLLESDDITYQGEENTAVTKAKNYYSACINKTGAELRGPTPMLELIGSLGSWTLTNDIVSGVWSKESFKLEQSIAKANKLGSTPFFAMYVAPDDKNSNVNLIQIQQAGLGLDSEDYYFDNNTEIQREAYVAYCTDVAILLGANETYALQRMIEIFEFESQLAKLFTEKIDQKDPEENYHKMTIADLQELVPAIDMMVYFDAIFENVNEDDDVIVVTPDYLVNMSQLIQDTDTSLLADYIVLQTILQFVGYLSEAFLDIVMSYLSVTAGVTDLPPRWQTCISRTDDSLGFVTGALYVQEKFPPHSKAKVEDLVTAIKCAFEENLPKVAWMDEVTRDRAMKKVVSIIDKIGYPKWLEHSNKLQEYYDKLDITVDNQFVNIVAVTEFGVQMLFDKLHKPVDKSEWDMSPAEVNAYYNPSGNEMVFPAAILQNPFYDTNFPMSINFGAIGMIMGHELTHGFDNMGRHYDEYGNLVNWWQNDSAIAFDEHAQCMVDQYSQYQVGDMHLNGAATISENIADNGGLKMAHIAYRHWVDTHPSDRLPPGLNLTSDQLFYLGNAQVWCTYFTPESAIESIYTDVHSNDKYRVIGPMSNSLDFAAAFGCPVGSPMNPEKKCTIW
ncbi:endothelin-converting enzyme 2-like [Saccoglossus kowalevskii]|uniref:Endothelin-converting enzyme 2-like n=1 Tax=Saccoglossus kowalevskii TaxID=10224 RepID=A0ABM0N191_SACKO|nr:PREDICTED: endothelin-converting enzyme 2-like [Saccoglossus kowalevskii]